LAATREQAASVGTRVPEYSARVSGQAGVRWCVERITSYSRRHGFRVTGSQSRSGLAGALGGADQRAAPPSAPARVGQVTTPGPPLGRSVARARARPGRLRQLSPVTHHRAVCAHHSSRIDSLAANYVHGSRRSTAAAATGPRPGSVTTLLTCRIDKAGAAALLSHHCACGLFG
jgi:hypothetical protein